MSLGLSAVTIGKKHSMLWMSGIGYISIGIVWMITGTSPEKDPAFDWLKLVFGEQAEAEYISLIWIVCGFIQLIPATLPSTRDKPVRRPASLGWGAALFAPTLWSVIYFVSVLYGNAYGVRHGAVFALFAVVAWEISGWEEPRLSITVDNFMAAVEEDRKHAAD